MFKLQLVCLLGTLLSLNAFAKPSVESIQPTLVDVEPAHTFIPPGFDDNDRHIQVVLDGELPSFCYHLAPAAKPRVDKKNHKIYIHQQAYFYPGDWCAQVTRPYTQTVLIGELLPAGEYEVLVERTEQEPKTVGILPVSVSANASPDDYLYAPVTSAYIERLKSVNKTTGESKTAINLVMHGNFSNSCMALSDVQVITRTKDVIEVLPTMTMEDKDCKQTETEFSLKVPLKNLASGRYLIHIRALDEAAVNKVVDL